MHEYFYTLADAITALLKGDEIYTCTFRGEDSDFVRFNRSAMRQAGTVTQRFLSLDLIRGQRHAAADVALSGDLEEDRARLTQAVAELREQLPYLPEDPILTLRHGGAVQRAPGGKRSPRQRDGSCCSARRRAWPRSGWFLCCRVHLCRICQCLWATELVRQLQFQLRLEFLLSGG